MQSNLHQWVLLSLQVVIDYIVLIAFLLALGGLRMGSAWSGFQVPRRLTGCCCFISVASQIYSPKFTESVRWSHSSQGKLLLSSFIITEACVP